MKHAVVSSGTGEHLSPINNQAFSSILNTLIKWSEPQPPNGKASKEPKAIAPQVKEDFLTLRTLILQTSIGSH